MLYDGCHNGKQNNKSITNTDLELNGVQTTHT